MAADPASLAGLAEQLRLLGHPARLAIALRLRGGECSVGELEVTLGLRQPGLSQQLAELRDGGLVASRRVARQVFYELADPAIVQLLDTLHRTIRSAGRLSAAPTPDNGDAARFGRIDSAPR